MKIPAITSTRDGIGREVKQVLVQERRILMLLLAFVDSRDESYGAGEGRGHRGDNFPLPWVFALNGFLNWFEFLGTL